MDKQMNVSSNHEDCYFVSSNALLATWMSLYHLLAPIFIYVLYVGYTQRRKQAPSHSDVFTLHIVAMEILAIVGTWFYIFRAKTVIKFDVGSLLYSTAELGQMSIHTLTCVERYLAVVHPITYLRLKKRGGVMIRNVSIAVVWLFCVGMTIVLVVTEDGTLNGVFNISLALFYCTVVTVCSLCVLWVLIRPGPGEGGGDKRRIDQSKQRAFITIVIILGVLLVRLVLFVVLYITLMLRPSDYHTSCLVAYSVTLLNIPSSLALPLMFLQKSGKLPKCSIVKFLGRDVRVRQEQELQSAAKA